MAERTSSKNISLIHAVLRGFYFKEANVSQTIPIIAASSDIQAQSMPLRKKRKEIREASPFP